MLEQSSIQQKKQSVGGLFDRIASTYDRLNHLLSLNIDRSWRRHTVRMMKPVDRVLDVAIGTADLTLEILRQHKAKQVTGIDLSMEMMRIGKSKTDRYGYPVEYVYANAQQMPLDSEFFDAVTCAYGCRNFSDLDAGLEEMFRVLRPGGEVYILEFSYPSNALIRWGYDLYFSQVLPFIGRMVSKDKDAYTYLNRSVKSFCWGNDFIAHMENAGFRSCSFTPLTFGITTIYRGVREE